MDLSRHIDLLLNRFRPANSSKIIIINNNVIKPLREIYKRLLVLNEAFNEMPEESLNIESSIAKVNNVLESSEFMLYSTHYQKNMDEQDAENIEAWAKEVQKIALSVARDLYDYSGDSPVETLAELSGVKL